ncbi:amidohydrolase family protein [Pigmentiphaga litoralis]|uniref:Cytosine/adenosine deaminase-related metal-dependent hydrolase n=1 Tax=Pigmentiphaga litoralis TaxID=516702 RepID=A0A7Y9ITM6_9BURK|nr:amidohydrolase family protein [Pigmentiphaga litoralis]NYE24118.1 cytosine/adenosine deaminase-related metal-dependent hydrolase [Pigmentiphaga litoralis]NYE82268.1 cytosine/adenosine deaminase-related metal-dependent hydrolase [Pigmentiphaga litoralis]
MTSYEPTDRTFSASSAGLTASALLADELLLAPEWLLLPDGPAQGMAVRIAQGVFAEIGPVEQLRQAHPALTMHLLPGRLLMPGFVDAHHHLTQSFGKALAFGEPSEIFRRIWVPLEGSLNEESLYLSAKLASLEALRGGFTTVCDAGTRAQLGLEAVARAAKDVGVRCVLGLICNDAGAEGQRDALLQAAERHIDVWADDALVHPSLAISTPEAASDGQLTDVARLSAERGVVFQTHVNEHLASVERSLVARGLRPLEHLDSVGALGPQTLVAHATLVTPYEMRLLKETDTAVSYNPVASVWKGNAVADAVTMSAMGIRVGLGTDGTRSDGFRLMDSAETNQRLAFGLMRGDSSAGGGALWLEQATAGGADVAGLGQRIGRIAEGLAADFLLVDMDVPEMLPSWDMSWELVRLANRDQIDAVFVNGALRLWRGWPVDWDARALMAEVRRIAATAVAKAPIQKIHPLSAAYRASVRR